MSGRDDHHGTQEPERRKTNPYLAFVPRSFVRTLYRPGLRAGRRAF